MAGLKEIRSRLQSVRNTKKITYAMKLVSAAKLRKAQESVTRSREYTTALNRLLHELLAEGVSLEHPLLEKREQVKNVRVLVVGGNRGLCGGYNSGINKRTDMFAREKSAAGVNVDWVLAGRKPAEYFRRFNRPYVASFEKLLEDANLWPFNEIVESFESDFLTGKVDEVYLIYTKFKSAISMTVTCDKLLPLEGTALKQEVDGQGASGLTLFEPSAVEVFSALMPRIMNAKVRQAALDAKASEQGSRMTAMDSATKNAGDLIKKLELTHNKLRQTSITSQLLDIVGGAEALN